MVEAQEGAADLRVVVRRALAREVGEEELGAAGRAGLFGAGEQIGGAARPVSRATQSIQAAAERWTAI